MSNNVHLLLSDARGTFIPRDFVEGFDVTEWGLDPSAWCVTECQNPDSEAYWDAWSEILDRAALTKDGKRYTLYQDGDLWAVAYDDMTDEERKEFFGDY